MYVLARDDSVLVREVEFSIDGEGCLVMLLCFELNQLVLGLMEREQLIPSTLSFGIRCLCQANMSRLLMLA